MRRLGTSSFLVRHEMGKLLVTSYLAGSELILNMSKIQHLDSLVGNCNTFFLNFFIKSRSNTKVAKSREPSPASSNRNAVVTGNAVSSGPKCESVAGLGSVDSISKLPSRTAIPEIIIPQDRVPVLPVLVSISLKTFLLLQFPKS